MNNDLISRSAMHSMVCLDTKRGAYGEFMDGSEVYFTSEEVHDMLDEAPAVEAVPQWISVKDRLPDKNALVLCAGARGGMFLGKIRWLYEEEGTAYCHVPNARNGRSATHWMPLPEPPKEV